VADVVKEIGKSKVLTLVASASEAHLALQIMGRRQTPKLANRIFDNNHFVRSRLTPGTSADRKRALDAMYRHEWTRQTARLIARPRHAIDYADLEAGSPFGMKAADEWVAGMVERFAREQYDPAKRKDRPTQ
jgi:hypothetical protein